MAGIWHKCVVHGLHLKNGAAFRQSPASIPPLDWTNESEMSKFCLFAFFFQKEPQAVVCYVSRFDEEFVRRKAHA